MRSGPANPRSPPHVPERAHHHGYLIDQVNALRAAHGLRALVVAPQLEDLAQDWSVHMAAASALSHNPAGATTTWSRYCASYWAENVGTGASASVLWSMYAASSAHRANILNPHLTDIGIATVDRKSASGAVIEWNTMEFSGRATRPGGLRRAARGGCGRSG